MKSFDQLKVLYLSRKDVEDVGLTMSEIIDEVEEAFIEKGKGMVEMPPKPGIHPGKNEFIHAMPAYVSQKKAAGIKWVSGYPNNFQIGLPYIMGLVIMNDPETGAPLAIMDASWITAMRTAAATAVAAKYMASKKSEVMAILGGGVEARSHLEAVDGADIVISVIAIEETPLPIIQREWLKEGCFGAAVAFDSGWSASAIDCFDRIVTDDVDQLNYYRSLGFFKSTPEVDTELTHLVSGNRAGRATEKERTLSINLGLAIEDVVTGIKIFEKAKDKKLGQWLPL